MRRTTTALAALVVLVAVIAQAALGAKPIREPLPPDNSPIPASVCGFQIDVETLSGKGTALYFEDRFMITGQLKLRLTNADDASKTLDLNIPGPGVFDESSLRGTGPWLLYFEPGDVGPGSPAMLVFVRGNFTIDETGYHLLGGNQIDLCPLLA